MEISSVPLFVGSLAVIVMAIIVSRASDGRSLQRWLSALLWLEGVSLLSLGLETLINPFVKDARDGIASAAIHLGESPAWAVAAYIGRDGAVLMLSFVYLAILSYLETPLSRWIRKRWAKAAIGLVLLASAIQPAMDMYAELRGGPPSDPGNLYIGGALVGLFAFACSVHAIVRAPRGSAARRRASAFALAFGVRDATTVAGFAVYAFSDGPAAWLFSYYPLVVGVGTVAFVALLAYGFLRTQLFDIDLKIKVGIERSTVLTLVAVGSIVTQRVVEHYATTAYGWAAAIVVAIAMLLLRAPLERVGHRVANTALPAVQPTPVYVAFKKLEVYKAALEGAMLDGKIDHNERAVLDKLREKLQIEHVDATALEREFTSSA